MARSPLALDAVTCAFCGAKVREDRVRCLRCGKALVASTTEEARQSAILAKLLAGAGVLAALALIGAVVLRPSAVPMAPVLSLTSRVKAEAAPASMPAPPVASPVRPTAAIEGALPAHAAYQRGDVGAALEHYRRAVELDPKDPELLNNLAQVLVRTGRASEAIGYFDQAIALASDRWAYHFNRAKAYGTMEQWRQAIAGYRDAARLFPGDYATHFNLAKALQKNGDVAGAIEGFERAIKLAPGQADFHLSHGLALEAAKRPADAVAAYKRFLDLAADSPDADSVKGRIAELSGAPAPAAVK